MPEFNLREYNIDDSSGGSDVASGARRNLDITFIHKVLKAHPLFPYLTITTSHFFILVNGFSVIALRI